MILHKIFVIEPDQIEPNHRGMNMRLEMLLQVLSNRYAEILGDQMIGFYLHGSIAFGCFAWEQSDVDFIVVVNEPLAVQTKIGLLDILEDLRDQAPPKGFEMSVVLQSCCKPFVYPTPFELHFSNGWRERYLADPLSLCGTNEKTDPDLAAHFTVIHQVGITLLGQPIPEVFGSVPHHDYLDSILTDVARADQDILDHPVYIVLNLCRVLAYVKDRQVLSKAQGGQWGMAHLPEPGRSIVRHALAVYSGNKDSFSVTSSAKRHLSDFAAFMLQQITCALAAEQ
jgi:streptomycin 3"-adenylyltransferase